MHAEAHTYTPSARMAALDVYLGRVFSRRAHYVRLSRLSLSLSLGVYVCTCLFIRLGPQCVHVPKTWFLIRRHEARMHQSAVSRRAVNLEQSSLLIRWLINAHGARAQAR
jgi:hypothetical protein